MHDAMLTALIHDRVDFIQLFLENGVNMEYMYSDVFSILFASAGQKNTSDILDQVIFTKCTENKTNACFLGR